MKTNKNLLICYNFWPLLADHALDASEEYYNQAGVTRQHNHLELDPEKVKEGDVVFVKTDAIVFGVFERFFDEIKHPFILVSGVSSFQCGGVPGGTDLWKKLLKSPKVIKWYCTNPPDTKNKKVIPLPIGFQEPSRPDGNQDLLNLCRDNRYDFSSKLDKVFLPYHTLSTNPVREAHHDLLKNRLFISRQCGKLPIESYLSLMDKHQFVICFEGAGWDTIRNYEALLVGSVPIMKRSPVERIFKYYNLPGIFVNDWNEVDEKFYEQTRKKEYDFSSVETFLRAENYKARG